MARPPIPVEQRAALIWARLRLRLSPEAAGKKCKKAKRTAQRYPDAPTLEALDYLIENGNLVFGKDISSRPPENLAG